MFVPFALVAFAVVLFVGGLMLSAVLAVSWFLKRIVGWIVACL